MSDMLDPMRSISALMRVIASASEVEDALILKVLRNIIVTRLPRYRVSSR